MPVKTSKKSATRSGKRAGSRRVRARSGAKQTSDRVSRIAAKVLRAVQRIKRTERVSAAFGRPFRDENGNEGCRELRDICTVAELSSLAASCLGQDEVRGRRGS